MAHCSGEEQQAFADLVGEFVGAVQDVGEHGVLRGLDEENQRLVVGMDGADVNFAFFAVDGDGAGRAQLKFSNERGTQGKERTADSGETVCTMLGTIGVRGDFKAVRRCQQDEKTRKMFLMSRTDQINIC